MMPGAWISTRRWMPPTMSPLPSIGSPSALTTRPSIASPTGTVRIRPVALTVWPSSMPNALAEDHGADRLLVEVQREADGAVLELEQLVDGAVGQAGDAGDAVADLGDAADGAGLERRLEALEVLLQRRGDVAGAQRELCHVGSLLLVGDLEAGLQLVDAGADAAVDDGVADGGDDAAEHGRVDDDLQVDLLAGGVGERGGEARPAGPSVSGDRERTSATSRFFALDARATSLSMIAGRSRPRPEPTTIDTSCVVVGVALPPRRSSTMAWRAAGRDLLVGERVAQRVARLEAAGEAEQLVLDLVERALGAGDLEQRRGRSRRCGRSLMSWAPTRAMKLSMSSCWVASSSEPVTTWSTAATDRRAISARSSSPLRPCAAAMSASGACLELGELLASSRAAAVVEDGRGLCVGLGEDAGALGGDVALGLADLRGLGGGAGAGRPTAASSSFWIRSVRARHRLLDRRTGELEQRGEDDQRREAAPDDLGRLRAGADGA